MYNVVTHLVSDRQTDQQSDKLLELLEWVFATKNPCYISLACLRKVCGWLVIRKVVSTQGLTGMTNETRGMCQKKGRI